MIFFKKIFLFILISNFSVVIQADNFKAHFFDQSFDNENNETESVINNFIPYISDYFNIDFHNHTHGGIIKTLMDNNYYFFDVARNITSGIKLAQFFIMNKTKTLIFPWITAAGKEIFKNIRNSTLNYSESDNTLIGNLIPLEGSFNYSKLNLNNSNWEETIIKPAIFIPYLRGSQNKNNETNGSIISNFVNLTYKVESPKPVNTTITRLNKYITSQNLNNTNKTESTNRRLQFTSLFDFFQPQDPYSSFGFFDLSSIPDVGNEIYELPFQDLPNSVGGFDENNGYFDLEFS